MFRLRCNNCDTEYLIQEAEELTPLKCTSCGSKLEIVEDMRPLARPFALFNTADTCYHRDVAMPWYPW